MKKINNLMLSTSFAYCSDYIPILATQFHSAYGLGRTITNYYPVTEINVMHPIEVEPFEMEFHHVELPPHRLKTPLEIYIPYNQRIKRQHCKLNRDIF